MIDSVFIIADASLNLLRSRGVNGFQFGNFEIILPGIGTGKVVVHGGVAKEVVVTHFGGYIETLRRP